MSKIRKCLDTLLKSMAATANRRFFNTAMPRNGEPSASVGAHSPNTVKEFLLSNANVLDDLSQERRRNVSA